VLDPACGSGSFLLGAYQFLLDHYRRWYEEHDPASHARGREPAVYQGAQGDWRLTTAEKKRILLDHIYGVDIDRQAVEVTKLSLLLKVLEGETEETVRQQLAFWHERALPDLGKNVQCGNSLIGPDYFEGRLVVDDDEVRRVNPFDWRRAFPEAMAAGGFDVIIGNPPYLKEYTYRQAFRDIRGTRLEGYYQGKMDIWYIFACLALDLLKPGGMHSFIATNNWITNTGASVLRTKIMSESQLIEFVDFGDFRVFESAGIQTMIYVLIKSPKHHEGTVRYRRITESTRPLPDVIEFLFSGRCDGFGVSFDASLGDTSGGAPFTFIEACDSPVLQRIEARGLYRLKASDVAQGIVSPQESVTPHHLSFLRDKTIRPGDGIFVLSSEEVASLGLSPLEDELVKPYYTTRELGRYYGAPANRLWIIYTKSDINDHIHRYPNIRRHLDRFAPVITSAFGPYGLHRAREESFFAGEKLVSLRKTRMPQFTYADFPCYVSQTFYILKPEDINLKYLVGLMNSRLVHFWLDKKGKKQGEQLQVDKQPLLSVPIRTIDFSDPADVARHDRMVALVERMLGLHKKLAAAAIPADKDLYRRQIEATDRQIDALVYELYGLTEQEIAIVEGAAG
jgi:adenine-specific DNA-methyltransferase